jgi:hypothetical protein
MKKPLIVLTVIGIGLIMMVSVLALVTTEDFDTREKASSNGLISIVGQGLDNGENLKIVAETESDNVWMCLSYGPQPTCIGCIYCIEEPVVKPTNNNNLTLHSFEKLKKTDPNLGGYFLKVCGCNDGNCNITNTTQCDTNVAVSNNYSVVDPQGSTVMNDSGFCKNGDVWVNADEKTNRDWLKYVITDKNGNTVYHEYETMWTFCSLNEDPSKTVSELITNKANACASEPFHPIEGESYTVNQYVCHTLGTPTEPHKDCDTKPLSTRTYTAPKCSTTKEVDAEIDIKKLLGDVVIENTGFEVEIRIKNNSTVNSGELQINVLFSLDPTCISCKPLQSQTVSVNDLSAGASIVRKFGFLGRPAGNYVIDARVATKGDVIDPVYSNNSDYLQFQIVSPSPTCTLTCGSNEVLDQVNCKCVECLNDNQCSSTESCDSETKACQCNDSLCSNGQRMNNSCTACVCASQCGANQWQDSNCACHQNSCTKKCAEKQVLTSDCECEDVACTNDIHCQNLEDCNPNTNQCVCNDLCSGEKSMNDSCSACQCPNTCESDETQRSDCSCIDKNAASLMNASMGDLVIEKENLTDKAFFIGDKILLQFSIQTDKMIDEENVIWEINGEEIGTGNDLQVNIEEEGDLKIDLLYEENIVDTFSLRVLGSTSFDDEQIESESQEETTSSLSSIEIGVIIISIVVIIASLVATIKIVLSRNKKPV